MENQLLPNTWYLILHSKRFEDKRPILGYILENGLIRVGPHHYEIQQLGVDAIFLEANQCAERKLPDDIKTDIVNLGFAIQMHRLNKNPIRIPPEEFSWHKPCGNTINSEFHEPVTTDKNQAPFLDYEGNKLFLGDQIRHPSGTIGTIVYDENLKESIRWRVKYPDIEGTLWLGHQVNDRGQAVKIKREITR